MRKQKTVFWLALFLSVFLCGCTVSDKDEPTGEQDLTITVFSIGKADAILVESEGRSMLIDCGEKEHGAQLLRELEAHSISRLDYLQITHFDKDHVGGAAEVASGVEIGQILLPDYVGRRADYFSFLKVIGPRQNTLVVNKPTTLRLGHLEFTVYPAESPEQFDSTTDEYDNEMSLVTMLCCGERRFLFCGDVEKVRLKQMLSSGTDWSCDWVKLPHHGRYCKALWRLLRKSCAQYAVMTTSDDAPAEKKTISTLRELGITSFDTCSGDVITHSDGDQIDIRIVEKKTQ